MNVEIVILLGHSGSGKTYSLRNIPPKEAVYLAANSKSLPWRGAATGMGKRTILCNELSEIPRKVEAYIAKGAKYIIIDDFSHTINARTLSMQFMADGAGANKYSRYEKLGRDIYNTVFNLADRLSTEKPAKGEEDRKVFIVLMNHTMTDTSSGREVFKSSGKMVGNTIDPVSYARICLHSLVLPDQKKPEDRYKFLTNDDGIHEAKSPPEMLSDQYIPNDMYAVLQAAEEFDKG